MSRLRAMAPGKVNLCLFLGPTRPDGRHDLVSVVEPLSLADELEMVPAGSGVVSDEVVCPGVEGENLAARALAAYRAATGWDGPPQRLTITKRVPVAAGMGGGSGDAAAALRLAAHASGQGAASDREPARCWPLLYELGGELGSDVFAQIHPGLALVSRAGEQVEGLVGMEPHFVVVVPSCHRLATGDVFAEADRLRLARSADDLAARRAEVDAAVAGSGRLAPELAVNDLQPAALSLCPEILGTLEATRAAGAEHAMVTGSGPTVFGLFEGPQAAARAEEAVARLAADHPAACVARPVDAAFAAPRSLP